MHWKKFSLDVKEMFYSENSHGHNLPRDVAESPSLGVFKMWLDRLLDNLIQASFSHGRLDPMMKKVPFQLGLFFMNL